MAAVLGTLQEAECLRRLATVSLGRVIASSGALPLIVPVRFALDGRAVVFRTTAGSPLARATDSAVVAFQADDLSPQGRSGWSVVVTGIAAPVRAVSDLLRLEQLGLPPEEPGAPDQWVRIPIGLVTGRSIAAGPPVL